MKVNAKFDKRVVVHSTKQAWLASPIKGVHRRPLDRVGDEVARATTIVKYEPNSHFSQHNHAGGEEFLVLDGVFQDEHGDYPVGSYIRNPPTSSHTPGSDDGCIIFVKLWQFDSDDRKSVNIDSNTISAIPHDSVDNVLVKPLYCDDHEEVSIQHWNPNSAINIQARYGLEVLVLDGSFTESNEILEQYSWIRLPQGISLDVKTGSQGAKVWLKMNHLKAVDAQIKRVSNVV